MAYITAAPNPIAIYDPAIGAYVHGTWDVQDGPQEARPAEVVVSINGAPTIPFMGPGYFGRFAFPVNLPNTYELILRYADTKSELTRVEIQTYAGHGEIAAPYSSDIPTTRAMTSAEARSSGGMDWAAVAIDGDGQLHAFTADGWSPAAKSNPPGPGRS